MKLRGNGVGAMYYGLGYGFSRPDFGAAEIEMAADGTITIWSGASELGQGLRTVLCQLAAEELGIPYEDTLIISSDTVKTPDAGPVSASRSTFVQGNAVLEAARELKRELRALASQLLGSAADQIEFQNGYVLVRDETGRSMSIGELAAKMHLNGRRVRGFGRYDITTSDVDPESSQGDAYTTYTWASQLAQVEVDTDTGQVKVLRLASIADAGKAINPKAVEGQIEGGALQGLGFSLMEEVIMKDGVFLNSELSTYLIPTAADMPVIEALIVEVPDPKGPLGAKGVGEPATIPTTAAILNAAANAVGRRLYRTPASPANMLSLLNSEEDRESAIAIGDIPFPPI
jgi:CO/xanthine dehydrogenase Mo-binding subunit